MTEQAGGGETIQEDVEGEEAQLLLSKDPLHSSVQPRSDAPTSGQLRGSSSSRKRLKRQDGMKMDEFSPSGSDDAV